MSGTASQVTRAQHAQVLKQLACQWADQRALAEQPVLRHLQEAARSQLQAMVFPDRKTEAWKYTGLQALENETLWRSVSESSSASSDIAIENAALRLRVNNGHAILEARDLPAGVQCQRLSDLDEAELLRYSSLLTLDTRWQSHPFAQLSEASLQDGWVVTVSAGKRIEQPIVIEQWADSAESFAASLRVLVVIERGAEATLVQLCDTPRDAGKSLLNSLVQVHVQDNASLQHVQLQMADEACHQVQVTQTSLQRDSRYQHYLVTLGTTLVRNDLHLQFTATGAEATLNGAFLSKHAQHVDNHLNLEHISGRCQSTTRYKGLITDQSRAVFNGRIHIHPQAQKTDAQLNNKNLLLSREAEIDTKPELEIYADDVKCAHGASIGQLDEKALFYFESRGIDKATAEAMLSFGFINEIVETLPVPGLADAVKQRLMAYFRDVKQLGGLCDL